MSDVGKVEKGKSGPEPTGPKRKKKHDSDAFKEMMKVGKVRETDPEEKRKRKRQAESEEEFKAEQGVTAPHQGLEPKPKEPSPFEPKQGTEGDFGAGAPTQQQPPQSQPPPFYSPSQEEPQQQQPTQKKEKTDQKSPPSPETQKEAPAKKKEKKETTPTGPVPHAKKPVKAQLVGEEKKVEGGMVPFTPSPQLKDQATEEKKKKTEETLVPPLPKGAWESTKESEKEKTPQAPLEPETTPLPTPQLAGTPPSTQAPPPLTAPFAHLSPQVAQLFERMAGVMTVMQESGISQTTINLDNPQFAHSAFYGAQVMITEFSTAPKAFNIELLGNQQAVDLFQGNAEELVAAFQAGNYNFKVNRIDTGYLPPSPAVRRKEARRVKRKKSGEG